VRRRVFIAGLGGTAWSMSALAQTVTTIGFLDLGSAETRRDVVADVRRGLSEAGYVEGRNLAIEYRWTPEDSLNRLPGLAADFVGRRVAAIIALQTPVVLAAKSATKTIPIVFETAVDPVEAGMVASLSRPSGNLTGMTTLVVEVLAKRLELLHQVVPSVPLIAFLINPLLDPLFVEPEKRELERAARSLGLRLLILNASHPNEFETAFAALVRDGAGGLVVSGASFFLDIRNSLSLWQDGTRSPRSMADTNLPLPAGS
jgi:putative tryptophan/tyrosine transport system substrate-binding protein